MADSRSAPPVAVRVIRPYKGEEEFLAAESSAFTRTGVVLIGAPNRPNGVVLRFELALRDGTPLMRGEGRVVGYRPQTSSEEGALMLRFTRLDVKSKQLLDKAVARREEKRAAEQAAVIDQPSAPMRVADATSAEMRVAEPVAAQREEEGERDANPPPPPDDPPPPPAEVAPIAMPEPAAEDLDRTGENEEAPPEVPTEMTPPVRVQTPASLETVIEAVPAAPAYFEPTPMPVRVAPPAFEPTPMPAHVAPPPPVEPTPRPIAPPPIVNPPPRMDATPAPIAKADRDSSTSTPPRLSGDRESALDRLRQRARSSNGGK